MKGMKVYYIDPKDLRLILTAIDYPQLSWWERLWRWLERRIR